ncbi:MAG: hypothetical protein Q7S31_00430 [bacterium]|nr:hypothetical protein [bacterium]
MGAKKSPQIVKLGRRPKYNEKTVVKILRGLRNGLYKEDAARLAGIRPETLSVWLDKYDDLTKEVERAQAFHRMRLVKQLSKHSKKQWQPAAWLLERIHPQQYSQKADLFLESNGVTIAVLSGGYQPLKQLDNKGIKEIPGVQEGEVVKDEMPKLPKVV